MVLNRRRNLRHRGERGAFVVIAAISMIALLAMSAVAIDLANARQQRRHAQAGADAAALAGAQDLPNASQVVATVKAYALENFGTPMSAWTGCQDDSPLRLAELPDIGNTNSCISIDESFSQVRVVLPHRDVETFFAGVVGIDEFAVSAGATAQAKLKRDDRVIPATVAAAAGSGNICIENGGNNVSCANRTSGNFGSFDSRRTSLYLPTSQEQNNSLRINYSMGIDHALAIWGTGTPRVCDVQQKSPCTTTNSSSGNDANHLIPATGNNVPPVTEGLIDNATISTSDGSFLFCGRLRRPDLTSSNLAETAPENCEHWRDAPGPGPSITVLGEKLNGRHVSYWMKNEFRNVFYPGINPTTQATTTATNRTSDPVWAEGDARLACFMKSYRFDYGGTHSKGHTPQTEFFIDPSSVIDNATADGTEFTLAQAKAYLKGTCGLPADFVDQKLASLTDADRFWPMFDREAVADPRFGIIPVVQFWSNGGSQGMPIVRFWAVYLYRLYPNGGNTKLDAVDAWVFEPALIETESGIADLQFGYQTDEPVVNLVE